MCLAIFAFTLNANAGNNWTKKASFSGTTRLIAASFTIGHYGYVGIGGNDGFVSGCPASYFTDFYRWNQHNNTWSSIAAYPGNGSFAGISFSIEGYGYAGLGKTNGVMHNDLWKYDTTTNTWSAMATFPGSSRYDASVFVLGHKAYVIGGSTGGSPYLNDVWVYDAHANTWKQLGNSPTGNTEGAEAFAIGNRGYVGGGWNSSINQTAFWQYDTTSDKWTSIAAWPMANGLGGNPKAFVIGSKAYCCNGTSASLTTIADGYVYDTVTKAWTVFTNMGANGIERAYAVAFAVGNYGYMGTGYDSTGACKNDFWQYYPCSDTLLTSVRSIVPLPGSVRVFPNPSNGMIHISYTGLPSEISELRIIDMLGRVIETSVIKGREGNEIINESTEFIFTRFQVIIKRYLPASLLL